MKQFIIAILLLSSVVATAQTKYEKGMQQALDFWGQGKNTEAVNLFERIGAAEKGNWLPYYYIGLINVLDGFTIKEKTQLQLKLDKAKSSIEKAKELSPDNAEIITLEALYNTVWIAFDGATYGVTLSGPTVALYKKAIALDPNNPRPVYLFAQWNIGSASYFGTDTKVYCADIEKALELFTTFKSPMQFYPMWGEEETKQLHAKICKQ